MSDPKRNSLERVESMFSDDIETICEQIGFDPKLYVEFPRKNRIPEFPSREPDREVPPPAAPAPAGNVASSAGSGSFFPPPAAPVKQPLATEIAEQPRMQQAVNSSWPTTAPAPAHAQASVRSAQAPVSGRRSRVHSRSEARVGSLAGAPSATPAHRQTRRDAILSSPANSAPDRRSGTCVQDCGRFSKSWVARKGRSNSVRNGGPGPSLWRPR